jgi:hypothetical protein
LFLIVITSNSYAQRGYYDAPYKRYEADLGVLTNGAIITSKSFLTALLNLNVIRLEMMLSL